MKRTATILFFIFYFSFSILFRCNPVFGIDVDSKSRELRRSEEPAVRMQAAEELGEAETEAEIKKAITVLRKAAKRDKDARVRARALKSLGKIVGESALPDIISALDDKDRKVRRAAVKQIRGFKKAKDEKLVRQALNKASVDEDDNVRAYSMRGFARMKDKKSVDLVIASLTDESMAVRIEAIKALGELGDTRAVGELKKLLEDEDVKIRLASAESLGKLKDKSGLEAILKEAENENPRIRVRAILALRDINEKNPEVTSILKKSAQDKDKRVKAAAKITMSFLGLD